MSIPMYVRSFSGYENSVEMLTKFGIKSGEEITLTMSKTQFITYYAPFIKSYYQAINLNRKQPVIPENPDYCGPLGPRNILPQEVSVELNPMVGQTEYRPKEGDLIFFPFDETIFEIKYVSFDDTFFQLGRNYTFDLQCEKFEYSGETFETTIDQIDAAQDTNNYYKLEFDLEKSGSGTFEFGEKVRIFDYNLVPGPQGPQEVIQDFSLDFFNSLSVKVPYITAKVIKWNKPLGKLVIGDISNSDPEKMDPCTYEVNVNDLDSVIIIGTQSGAVWKSTKAQVEDQIFDDGPTFQKELDRIKIVDKFDENPYGFY